MFYDRHFLLYRIYKKLENVTINIFFSYRFCFIFLHVSNFYTNLFSPARELKVSFFFSFGWFTLENINPRRLCRDCETIARIPSVPGATNRQLRQFCSLVPFAKYYLPLGSPAFMEKNLCKV